MVKNHKNQRKKPRNPKVDNLQMDFGAPMFVFLYDSSSWTNTPQQRLYWYWPPDPTSLLLNNTGSS